MDTPPPPDRDPYVHHLRTALATALMRVQLAQRHLARGRQDGVARHLVEIERQVKQVITLVEEHHGRDDPPS